MSWNIFRLKPKIMVLLPGAICPISVIALAMITGYTHDTGRDPAVNISHITFITLQPLHSRLELPLRQLLYAS